VRPLISIACSETRKVSFGQGSNPQGQKVDTSSIKEMFGQGEIFSLDTDFNFVYDDPTKIVREQARENAELIRNAIAANDIRSIVPELNGKEVSEHEMKIIEQIRHQNGIVFPADNVK